MTAFEPFDNRNANSSLEIMSKFCQSDKSDVLTKIILPVVYQQDEIIQLIKNYDKYDLVVNLGEAANRKRISLEAVALNVMNADISDNHGVFKHSEAIIPGSNAAYVTEIDLKKITNSINSNKIEVSYHAGTYICNLVYYRGLHIQSELSLNTKVIFIHFPLLNDEFLLLEEAVYYLNLIIEQIKSLQ